MNAPREEPRDIDYFKFKEALERLRKNLAEAQDSWTNGDGATLVSDIELDKFEKEVLEND
jgi:hypothetical protein